MNVAHQSYNFSLMDFNSANLFETIHITRADITAKAEAKINGRAY